MTPASLVTFVVAATLVVAGATVIMAAFRTPAIDAGAVLAELEATDVELDEFTEQLAQPFISRLVKPIGRSIAGRVASLLPGNYLNRLRHKLLVAGLLEDVRPEEFVVVQVIGVAGGLLSGPLWSALVGLSGPATVKATALATFAGAALPQAWLRRKRDERQGSIRRDLPDVLDLLAISVEAGAGFEAAVDVATRHFDSPLARELARTLREMELGLTRREALQNLKRRTEVPELSNFVLTLIQADALGMPIGRVLRAQSTEMRSKRRQWAREKAGKLPVKIMFPLIAFIFPALLVVVLGPAAASILKGL
jgi:tight adherence protein C